MAVWEIALLLFGATYLIVNMVVLIVQLKMMAKMEPIVNKSFKMFDKMMDLGEKAIDELYEED